MRWDYSIRYVQQIVKAAEYRAVLPEASGSLAPEETTWTEYSVRELTRIPDTFAANGLFAPRVSYFETNRLSGAGFAKLHNCAKSRIKRVGAKTGRILAVGGKNGDT